MQIIKWNFRINLLRSFRRTWTRVGGYELECCTCAYIHHIYTNASMTHRCDVHQVIFHIPHAHMQGKRDNQNWISKFPRDVRPTRVCICRPVYKKKSQSQSQVPAAAMASGLDTAAGRGVESRARCKVKRKMEEVTERRPEAGRRSANGDGRHTRYIAD